jgi:tRNA G10  N-methylase Trm11
MRQLGGTVKLGDVIGTLPLESIDGEALADLVVPFLDGEAVDFGCTIFGAKKPSKLPIQLKKALKARGFSSRWVTGKDGAPIAPAAISKMELTTKGFDLCLFVEGSRMIVGRTSHVQDADGWSFRDYGRPKRDEVMGMLPPKLARMMVNLAKLPSQGTLLDPFCGGGTVLMEAALATDAAHIFGSDVDANQISNAKENTKWLKDHHVAKDVSHIEIAVADARNIGKKFDDHSIDAVVTEGTLGPALRGHESERELQKNADEITRIWKETLRSLHSTLSSEGRIIGVWPAFKTPHGTVRVELNSNELSELGYQLIPTALLLYHRPGQFVMRRIVILETLH